MVHSCVCFGCNNSNLSGHRVHRFPNKKDNHFRAWIRCVQAKRSNFTASSVTRHTVLCEEHFTLDGYNQGDLMELRLGLSQMELCHLCTQVSLPVPATSGGSESSTSRESAYRKRELCTVSPIIPILLKMLHRNVAAMHVHFPNVFFLDVIMD